VRIEAARIDPPIEAVRTVAVFTDADEIELTSIVALKL
jgi:hypothetical protein